MSRFSIYDTASVDRLFRRHRVDPHHLRRFRNAYLKHTRPEEEALACIPDPCAREAVRGEIGFRHLEIERRQDSGLDGATKLLLRTEAGFRIESVILRITTGRTALCVSSQVGCAAACRFCATAGMGVARSLPAREILDQVSLANRLLAAEGRWARNVVFMGMGEPFHNEDAVTEAVEVLTSPRCFAQAPGRVLVSTVGIPDAMLRFARRFPRCHLALSLHAARQEVRERIVPLARVHPVEALRDAVAAVNRIQGRRVMVEYLMLDGVNDRPEDLEALARWLEGLDVHVNLIPYNPIAGAPELRGTSRPASEAFANGIRRHGWPVTLRYSLGRDIDAACGQLVRRENRGLARAAAD